MPFAAFSTGMRAELLRFFSGQRIQPRKSVEPANVLLHDFATLFSSIPPSLYRKVFKFRSTYHDAGVRRQLASQEPSTSRCVARCRNENNARRRMPLSKFSQSGNFRLSSIDL